MLQNTTKALIIASAVFIAGMYSSSSSAGSANEWYAQHGTYSGYKSSAQIAAQAAVANNITVRSVDSYLANAQLANQIANEVQSRITSQRRMDKLRNSSLMYSPPVSNLNHHWWD